MKTSARNTFSGQIEAIKTGAVNDEITLKLMGNIVITAIITHASKERLNLQVGAPAFALIKSSSVIVATEVEGIKLSTRNSLTGTVSQLKTGAVNAEVTLDLGHHQAIVAIITNESVAHLALEVGKTATAFFKASSVIIGTKD